MDRFVLTRRAYSSHRKTLSKRCLLYLQSPYDSQAEWHVCSKRLVAVSLLSAVRGSVGQTSRADVPWSSDEHRQRHRLKGTVLSAVGEALGPRERWLRPSYGREARIAHCNARPSH